MLSFDLNTIEGKIAYAIYDIATEHFPNANEFCEAYGFTKEQFEDFLQHGIEAMKAFRIMNEYYEKVEGEK